MPGYTQNDSTDPKSGSQLSGTQTSGTQTGTEIAAQTQQARTQREQTQEAQTDSGSQVQTTTRQKWLDCLSRLESDLGPSKFKPWIKPLQFLDYDDQQHRLRLGLGSVLKINMVKENLLSTIEDVARRIIDERLTVSLELNAIPRQAAASAVSPALRTQTSPNSMPPDRLGQTMEVLKSGKEPPAPTQEPLFGFPVDEHTDNEPAAPQLATPANEVATNEAATDADEPSQPKVKTMRDGAVRLIPEFTFDTLVDGKSNQMAVSAAMQVVGQPGGAYNPLFLYGGVGLGKTHLLNAVGNAYLNSNPGARISYVHAQAYFDEMVLAIQRRTPHDFKRKYQSLDLLLIDDIQFLSNRERTQEEFFYTFEALLSARKQMVITCDTYPRHLSAFQERLRSRFGSGLIVEIEPPELELRVAILLKKGEQLKRERPEFPPLTEDIAFFIAQTVRSNVRELEGALIRTLAFASFRQLDLTMDVAREASRDLLKQHQIPVSIEQIQKTVSDFFKIRIGDMYSKRRPANIARARQVAMFLAKELTNKSFPEIGEAFGGRDHTTVMHAVKRITQLRQDDPELNRQIHMIEQSLTE